MRNGAVPHLSWLLTPANCGRDCPVSQQLLTTGHQSLALTASNRGRTQALVAPTTPQGVLVRGHAGRVMNELSSRTR